jgi:D-sedoheptulose 7-phosphate isomerase
MSRVKEFGLIEKHEIESRILEIQNLVKSQDCFNITDIEELARKITDTFRVGKKIAFVGNGGSAAEAMHLAAEFTGKCVIDHEPLPALCLNESQSALTSIANDYGTNFMFSRLVSAHLDTGDILIALSTSGKSTNILNAIEVGLEKGVEVYLWSGQDATPTVGAKIWRVPSTSTPRIQEVHLMWGHILAELVESNFSH